MSYLLVCTSTGCYQGFRLEYILFTESKCCLRLDFLNSVLDVNLSKLNGIIGVLDFLNGVMSIHAKIGHYLNWCIVYTNFEIFRTIECIQMVCPLSKSLFKLKEMISKIRKYDLSLCKSFHVSKLIIIDL